MVLFREFYVASSVGYLVGCLGELVCCITQKLMGAKLLILGKDSKILLSQISVENLTYLTFYFSLASLLSFVFTHDDYRACLMLIFT